MELAASDGDEANRMKAEFAVGLRPSLPIKALKVEEIRFGISKVIHESAEADSHVELTNRTPDTTTVIKLERADHAEIVELRCDTYLAASVFPDLPDEFQIVRFVARFLSATMGIRPSPDLPAGQLRMWFKWTFSSPRGTETVSLEDLGATARAALLLHSSHAAPIHMKLSSDNGKGFERTDTKADSGIDPSSLHYWTAIDRAHRLATRFRLTGAAIQAGPLLEQAEALEFLASCISGPRNTARFRGDVPLAETPDGDRVAMIVAPYVQISDYIIGFCVALVGTPSWSPLADGSQRLEVTEASMRIFKEFRVGSDAWKEFDLLQTFEAARKTLQEEGVLLVICPTEDEQPEPG